MSVKITAKIKRKDIDEIINMIKQFNPKAFYSIEEVRAASEGIFPFSKSRYNFFGKFRLTRPGK
ncbi:MAG: DUF2179 domain-containing protein [Candidatus Methanoperedens sp.]|nr:DUF2179 domain-containing protein [Candidatus Methanoperedens sp.]